MLSYREKLSLELRNLYSAHGYRRLQIKKFEEYDYYVDNKSFLKEESIISFMDLEGKLLALKPDVTLSIVKNIPDASNGSFEKMYYNESVYRLSKTSREYKEIHQVGVELAGEIDSYAVLEIMTLAIKSLQLIGKPFLLDISHLGFVSGLLNGLDLGYQQKKEITDCIYSKNSHDLCAILAETNLGETLCRKIAAVPLLYGSFDKTLKQAKELVVNQEMETALQELEGSYSLLQASGFGEHIALDFSLVNDVDYYNGIIFQGYIEGVSDVVLSGGRYDNLMRKLGKAQGALGFAITMDTLAVFTKDNEYDFDIYIAYGDSTDYRELQKAVARFTGEGKKVRVEKSLHSSFRCRQVFLFDGGELKEYTADGMHASVPAPDGENGTMPSAGTGEVR